MMDWFLDRLPTIGGIVFAVVIGFIIYGAIEGDREHDRLVKQCIDDGHKEYECEALLKRDPPPQTTIITTGH